MAGSRLTSSPGVCGPTRLRKIESSGIAGITIVLGLGPILGPGRVWLPTWGLGPPSLLDSNSPLSAPHTVNCMFSTPLSAWAQLCHLILFLFPSTPPRSCLVLSPGTDGSCHLHSCPLSAGSAVGLGHSEGTVD